MAHLDTLPPDCRPAKGRTDVLSPPLIRNGEVGSDAPMCDLAWISHGFIVRKNRTPIVESGPISFVLQLYVQNLLGLQLFGRNEHKAVHWAAEMLKADSLE